jgi:hypothetical protein
MCTQFLVGASLLAKAVVQLAERGDWATAIASKLAPTGGLGGRNIEVHHRSTVGASLLAMAFDPSTTIPKPPD